MGLFINDRKLKAAASSMHQFCQEVRCIFPGQADDRVVEAATAYLYVQLAHDLFGVRFARKLSRKLRANLKYVTPAELEGRVAGIGRYVMAMEESVSSVASGKTPEEICRLHVSCTVEALLTSAGYNGNDQEVGRKAYPRFEEVIRNMRKHLLGIREQNYFLMKSRTA